MAEVKEKKEYPIIWFPPVLADPPPDGRMWEGREVGLEPAWDKTFKLCMANIHSWVALCATRHPHRITWRITNGRYGATKRGRWETVQRAVKDSPGYSVIWVRCTEEPEP